MPTPRDWLIATIMGEDNRADVQGMQGIADVIFNRMLEPTRYGAPANATMQQLVTARNGLEFNTWRPSDNSYDRASRALQGIGSMRGAEIAQYQQAADVVDAMLENGTGRGISQGATFYQTPTAPNQYQSGTLWPRYGNITIGNHIYTGDRMVRDLGEYQRQNPQFYTFMQAPAPGQDGFGVNVDVSRGAGEVGPGGIGPNGSGNPTGYGPSYNTPTSGPGDAFGFGPGANTLGSAVPFGNVGRFAFGNGFNPSVGMGNGQFLPSLSSFGPAPGPYGFTNANAGGGVGPGQVGQLPAGFDPAAYLAANPDVAQAGADPRQHYLQFGAAEGRPIAPGVTAPTLPPGTTSYAQGPGSTVGTQGPGANTPTLPPGFNEQAYLQANPDLVTALVGTGVSPAQHYLRFGMQEGRAIAPNGTQPTLGPNTNVPTLSTGGTAPTLNTGTTVPTLSGTGSTVSTLGPDTTVPTLGPGATVPTLGPGTAVPTLGPNVTVPTLGGGATVPTLGAGGTVPTLGPAGTAPTLGGTTTVPTLGPAQTLAPLPPNFDANSYVQANPDLVQGLAGTGITPAQHYQMFGAQEQRPLAPSGAVPTLGPSTTVPTLGPSQTTTAYSPGQNPASGANLPMTPVPTLGPGPAVGTQGPTQTAATLPPGFSEQAYIQANPDLIQGLAGTGVTPAQHYLRFGMQEGRAIAPSVTAPTLNTATNAPTLNTATPVPTLGPGPTVTAQDGPEIMFDPGAYLSANPDVAASGMNPFQHFVLSGWNEGRALNPQGQTFGSQTPGFLTFDVPSLTSGWDSGLSSTFLNNIGYSTGGAAGGGIGNSFGFSGANTSGFNVNAPGMGSTPLGFSGGVAYQNNPSVFLPSGAPRSRISSEAFFRAQQASRDYMAQRAVPLAAQNYNYANTQLANMGAQNTIPNLTLTNYQATQNQVGGGLLGAGGTVNHNAGGGLGAGLFPGGSLGTTWVTF